MTIRSARGMICSATSLSEVFLFLLPIFAFGFQTQRNPCDGVFTYQPDSALEDEVQKRFGSDQEAQNVLSVLQNHGIQTLEALENKFQNNSSTDQELALDLGLTSAQLETLKVNFLFLKFKRGSL